MTSVIVLVAALAASIARGHTWPHMQPYYQSDDGAVTIYCARVEDVEPLLADGSVHLSIDDGPYHGVKPHGWDNEHDSDEAFLAWKRERFRERRRILAQNGTLYDYASAAMGSRVEVVCREIMVVLCNIRWKKPAHATKAEMFVKESLRSPFPASETIIMAEQYGSDSMAMGESQYARKCDELRGFVFEPLRAYLDGERKRAMVGKDECNEACGFIRTPGGMAARHYFSRSQWCLPTAEHYAALQKLFNRDGGDFLRREYEELRVQYEELRVQYEELRVQYEELRRPFFMTAADQYTDVWNDPTVQDYPGKHPCEKPREQAERIVRVSSRPGNLVFVPYSGKGVFAAEAIAQGRRVIACDVDPHWAEETKRACVFAREHGFADVRKTTRRPGLTPDDRQVDLFGARTT